MAGTGIATEGLGVRADDLAQLVAARVRFFTLQVLCQVLAVII